MNRASARTGRPANGGRPATRPQEPPQAGTWPRVQRAGAYALVLLLALLLALWGAFLVPFRVGGNLVPVSWVIAVVGNLAVGRAGGRLAGSTGALVPGLVWFAIAFTLSSRRAEGDVVVPGTLVGLVFLLAGALASAVAYGTAVTRPRT